MATSARAATRLAAHTKPASSSLRFTATHQTYHTLPRQAFQASSRRGYANGGPQQGRSRPNVALYGFMFATTAFAAVTATYYVSQHQGEWDTSKKPEPADPKDIDPKLEAKASTSFAPKKEDYQQVYNAVAKRLEEKDDYDDGSYGPVLVRLAWHCSGTYDKDTKTGGSNGATMRFAPEGDHGANAGLKAARDFLAPVKTSFPWITYSDLWTLAGVCAIQEMQGPVIPWRPGRSDRDVSMCTPDGRLPDGAKEQSHLRAIFGRMGFDDREIVALSGAHALGRCHTDRSGFDGPWSFSPTVMSNDYYRLLMDEKWGWRKWNGPKQYEDKSTKTLMMLPTDMALIEDPAFRKHVERYAKDDQVFFKEFKDVIVKLLELGVPFQSKEEDRMTLAPLEE